jgi:hypothetical protein
VEHAKVNGVELEYAVVGSGEPMLLIHGAHIADALQPSRGSRDPEIHRPEYPSRGRQRQMSDWTAAELDRIGGADELEIAALGPDGTPRPATAIWVVRLGDDLYVRSCRGRRGGWFRSVLRRPEGRIRAGGVTHDVAFQEPDDADHAAIDQAYQIKYARYGNSYVDPMVSPDATAATLRLIAR